MDRIPLTTLLTPCASDGGVGLNLEYDSRHMTLCQLAEGAPEQEYGQLLVAAQEPNWRKVYDSALELCIETRDLRIAVLLTESLCRLQGFAGVADGLNLILGWAKQFWDELYPQLDPDDADPVERISALNRLCHRDYLLAGLIQIPLAADDTLGSVTLQGLRRIGKTPEERADVLSRQEIEAIFLSEPLEQLQASSDAIQNCLTATEHLRTFLDDKLGRGQWDSAPLDTALRDCANAVENAYGQRVGVVYRPPIQAAESVAALNDEMKEMEAESGQAPSSASSPPAKMVIGTRAEAVAVLDSLCRYFQTHEPASPVPLLLERAKRLIPMSFVDILRELAPDGLLQAMQSVGAKSEDR